MYSWTQCNPPDSASWVLEFGKRPIISGYTSDLFGYHMFLEEHNSYHIIWKWFILIVTIETNKVIKNSVGQSAEISQCKANDIYHNTIYSSDV